jgi:hypothetical protein
MSSASATLMKATESPPEVSAFFVSPTTRYGSPASTSDSPMPSPREASTIISPCGCCSRPPAHERQRAPRIVRPAEADERDAHDGAAVLSLNELIRVRARGAHARHRGGSRLDARVEPRTFRERPARVALNEPQVGVHRAGQDRGVIDHPA